MELPEIYLGLCWSFRLLIVSSKIEMQSLDAPVVAELYFRRNVFQEAYVYYLHVK